MPVYRHAVRNLYFVTKMSRKVLTTKGCPYTSYLAIGPVYPTTLKVMPYDAVGLESLRAWTLQVSPCPVVAIGGISLERLPAVLACGVQGVAVVSAVTQASDPQAASSAGLRAFAEA